MRITLGLGLAAGCACGCVSAPQAPPSPAPAAALPAADSVAVRAATLAVRSGSAVDRLWPGYWSPARAFLLSTPSGGAVLVSPGAAPAGFRPLSLRGTSPAGGRAYWIPRRPPDLRGELDLSYRVGGVVTTALGTRADVPETLVMLYHEAFHTYQGERFSAAGDTSEALPDSLLGEESALSKVAGERRVLADALLRESPDSIRAAARRFLRFRAERFARAHPWVLRIQRQLERYEGSAHLIGTQGRLVALGGDPRQAVEHLRAELLEVAPDAPPWVGRYWVALRWHAYAAGGAMALLLDRVGEPDWRSRVETGTDLDALLARAARCAMDAAGGLGCEEPHP